MLPLSEKLEVLGLNKAKKKNCMLKLPRSIVRINPLFLKLWKRKEKVMLVLLSHLRLQKLMAVVYDKP